MRELNARRARAGGWKAHLRRCWPLYLFLLPALLDVLVFRYAPMYGLQIAFKNFRVKQGIWGSAWVGFKYFDKFLMSPNFWQLIRNTLLISVYSLALGFPIPIFLALMINEIRRDRYKRFVQTVTYAPHFLSLVALVGLMNLLLARETGLLNILRELMGKEKLSYLSMSSAFRTIYVVSGIWQQAGWNSVIYLAALSAVDAEVLEAAKMDGVSRLQNIWYVNLPTILPTIVILLVMRSGTLLSVGYEKILLMQNSLVKDVSEVISTYSYRIGILDGQYSYTTAIGMFNSVINGCILVLVNAVSKKLQGSSLW